MNLNATHIAGALALLALGYMMGRNKARQGTATQANDTTGAPAQWWSYAGQW